MTGVKLEIGSVATPFNRQSPAKSMADCQRYYRLCLTTSVVFARGYHVAGATLWRCITADVFNRNVVF